MKQVLVVWAAVVAVACGGHGGKPASSQPIAYEPKTAADRILPMLPDGAQVIVELDLARLRANPIVGALVTSALTGEGLPVLPGDVPVSPLAKATALVLASYGVGTAQAATVIVLATTEEVAGSTRLADGIVALGPVDWVAQLEARAALAADATTPLAPSRDLVALRDHAMPANAPGASIRVTARLPFDARVSLARETGLDPAPAQVSIWGDVVDDLAIVIDVEASDPGDAKTKQPGNRLEAGMRGVLAGIADLPAVRALGLPTSLTRARLVVRGTWVRAIIAVGPSHLQRVVERARTYLQSPGSPEGAS